MSEETTQKLLQFSGHRHLTTRLLLSTLTGRPIRITSIRPNSTNPGLSRTETNFVRLLDSVTNGASIQFSMTGTTLVYRPGLITGSTEGLGASSGILRHEIPKECSKRGVSWWLIPLCILSPFSKGKVNVVLHGEGCVTSATPTGDVSVDTVRTAILPLFKNFAIDRDLEIRILKRSCAPPTAKSAGGEVQLVFNHQVRLPKTLHLMNPGRVKRIRGVAYSVGVPGADHALITTARGVLNQFAPDTYIFADKNSAPWVVDTGPAAAPGAKKKCAVGFGLSLVAESSTHCLYSADLASPPQGGVAPDEIGAQCAYQLLEKIAQGGCVESTAAPAVLMLMAMGSEDVGRVVLGRQVVGSEEIVQLARDMKGFGGSGWGLRDAKSRVGGEEEEGDADGGVVVSVVGRGVGNVGRKVA